MAQSETYGELFNVTTGTLLNDFNPSGSPGTGYAWVISRLNVSNPGTNGNYCMLSDSNCYLTGGGAGGESLADNSHDKWNGLVVDSDEQLQFSSNNGMQFVAYGALVQY